MTTHIIDIVDLCDDDDTEAVAETIADEKAELIGANRIWCIPVVPLECMPFWKKIKQGRIPIEYIESSHHQPLRELQLQSNVKDPFTYRLKAQQRFQPVQKKKRLSAKQLYDKFCKPVSVVIQKMPLNQLTRYMYTPRCVVAHSKQNLCRPTLTVPPYCRPSLLTNSLQSTASIPMKSNMEIIKCTPSNKYHYSSINSNRTNCNNSSINRTNYIGSFVNWLVNLPEPPRPQDKPKTGVGTIAQNMKISEKTIALSNRESTKEASKIIKNNTSTITVERKVIKMKYNAPYQANNKKYIHLNDKSMASDQLKKLKLKSRNYVKQHKGTSSNLMNENAEKNKDENHIIQLKGKSTNKINRVFTENKAKTNIHRHAMIKHTNTHQMIKEKRNVQKSKANMKNKSAARVADQIIKLNERGNIILVRAKPKTDQQNANISQKNTSLSNGLQDLVDATVKKKRLGTKLKIFNSIKKANATANQITSKVSSNNKSQNHPPNLNFTLNNNSLRTVEPLVSVNNEIVGRNELPVPIMDTSRNHALNATNVSQKERNTDNIQHTGNVNLTKALSYSSDTAWRGIKTADLNRHLLVEAQNPPLFRSACQMPIPNEMSGQEIRNAFSWELLNKCERRHIDDILVDVGNSKHHLVLLRIGKEQPVLMLTSGHVGFLVFSETPQPLGDAAYVAWSHGTHYIVDFSHRECSRLKLDKISEYTSVNHNGYTFKVLPDGLDKLEVDDYKEKDKIDHTDLTEREDVTFNSIADITPTTKSAEDNRNNNTVVHSLSRNIRIEYVTDQNIHNSAIPKDNNDNKIGLFQHNTEDVHISDNDTLKCEEYDTSHQSGQPPDNKDVCLVVSDKSQNNCNPSLSKSESDPFNVDKCEDNVDFSDILIENSSVNSDDIDLNNIVIENFGIGNLEDDRERSYTDTKQADQNVGAVLQNSTEIIALDDVKYPGNTICTVNISKNLQNKSEILQVNFEKNLSPTIRHDDSVEVSAVSDLRSERFQSKSSSVNIGDCKNNSVHSEFNSVTAPKLNESNQMLPNVSDNDKSTNAPVGRIKVKAFAKLVSESDKQESSNLDLIEADGRLYKRLNREHAIYGRVLCSVGSSSAWVPSGRVFGWRQSEGLIALHHLWGWPTGRPRQH